MCNCTLVNGLDIAVYKVGTDQDTKLEDNEINLMEEETQSFIPQASLKENQKLQESSPLDNTTLTPRFFMNDSK